MGVTSVSTWDSKAFTAKSLLGEDAGPWRRPCPGLDSETDTGGKRAGNNLWKTDTAAGHDINGQNQQGPGWWMRLSLDLEPQSKLILILQQGRHDSSKTNHKKSASGPMVQFLEIPTPCPKQLEYPSHPVAYEITQPYKTYVPRCCSCFPRWPTLCLWSVFLSK